MSAGKSHWEAEGNPTAARKAAALCMRFLKYGLQMIESNGLITDWAEPNTLVAEMEERHCESWAEFVKHYRPVKHALMDRYPTPPTPNTQRGMVEVRVMCVLLYIQIYVHISRYIYVYICVCMCMYVCVFALALSVGLLSPRAVVQLTMLAQRYPGSVGRSRTLYCSRADT